MIYGFLIQAVFDEFKKNNPDYTVAWAEYTNCDDLSFRMSRNDIVFNKTITRVRINEDIINNILEEGKVKIEKILYDKIATASDLIKECTDLIRDSAESMNAFANTMIILSKKFQNSPRVSMSKFYTDAVMATLGLSRLYSDLIQDALEYVRDIENDSDIAGSLETIKMIRAEYSKVMVGNYGMFDAKMGMFNVKMGGGLICE